MSINLDEILKIEGYTRKNRAHRVLVCKQIQSLPYKNMKLLCHLIKTGREFLKTYDTKEFDRQKRLLKKDYAEIQKVRLFGPSYSCPSALGLGLRPPAMPPNPGSQGIGHGNPKMSKLRR